jgi:hypothetical protein
VTSGGRLALQIEKAKRRAGGSVRRTAGVGAGRRAMTHGVDVSDDNDVNVKLVLSHFQLQRGRERDQRLKKGSKETGEQAMREVAG